METPCIPGTDLLRLADPYRGFSVRRQTAPADVTRISIPGGGFGRRTARARPIEPEPEPLDLYQPADPEPAREEAPESRPAVVLRNPRWSEAKGCYDGKATAMVDTDPPRDPATRIIFKAWAEWGPGNRMDLPPAEGHLDESGTARAEIVLYPPCDVGGNPVPACAYFFTAKHSRSVPVKSRPLEAAPDPDGPFEGIIFYSPARDEYLVIDKEEDFKPLLSDILDLKAYRGKAEAAWEIPDSGRRLSEFERLKSESTRLFGVEGTHDSKRALEELLLVQRNRKWGEIASWAHVPAHSRSRGQVQVKGHWRKPQDALMRKRLDQLLHPKRERLRSPFLNSRFKANLFETEPKAGDLWHWSRKRGSAEAEGAPAQVFDYSAEAAIGRYFAGWDGGEWSIDPRKKSVKLGVSGNASASLFEGKVTVAVDLPDEGGLNILGWVGKVKYREAYLVDPRRACMLKLRLEGSLAAFVGDSVHGALTVSGSLADGRTASEAGVEAGLFAGAQGQGEARGCLNWAPSRGGPFGILAAAKIATGGSAGAGAEAQLKVEYADGNFRFHFSAAACLGLGLRSATTFEVGVKDAVRLLGHLYDCLDFHFLAVVSQDAFRAYRNYTIALFTARLQAEQAKAAAARAEIDWAKHKLNDFKVWLQEMGDAIVSMKLSIKARSGNRSELRKAPPESLGRLLVILMETRKESDFQAIRYILGSTVRAGDGQASKLPSNHKLKWVLRSVSEIGIPAEKGPLREARKKEAMEDGIRIIREFGMADGKWKNAKKQSPNMEFTAWLLGFLEENHV